MKVKWPLYIHNLTVAVYFKETLRSPPSESNEARMGFFSKV